jgi:bifunctional UDP-N-acetylglucosamine pyrophosphorylase/glucosamine-1-phosphate N-acetyltransferase
LRAGAAIGNNCRIGDYVEIKKSVLRDNVKAAHLAYIGDAEVGSQTNIGCGTVFANYNGKIKQKTIVGEGAFIGANANLVAPLIIGDNAFVAAGSTVTENIPKNALAIARKRQIIKENYRK